MLGWRRAIQLGNLAVVVIIDGVTVQWTGPIHRLALMSVYCMVAGLSLRGAWLGLSGLRKSHFLGLSVVRAILNRIMFAGPGFVLFLIFQAGH